MGYYQILGACVVCRRPFMFHPHKVPSVRVHGVREPVCFDCLQLANAKRRAAGVAEIPILPGAYDGAADENDMDDIMDVDEWP